MAKKEVKIDLWVARQLDDCKIKYDAQKRDISPAFCCVDEDVYTAQGGEATRAFPCQGRWQPLVG